MKLAVTSDENNPATYNHAEKKGLLLLMVSESESQKSSGAVQCTMAGTIRGGQNKSH